MAIVLTAIAAPEEEQPRVYEKKIAFESLFDTYFCRKQKTAPNEERREYNSHPSNSWLSDKKIHAFIDRYDRATFEALFADLFGNGSARYKSAESYAPGLVMRFLDYVGITSSQKRWEKSQEDRLKHRENLERIMNSMEKTQ